MTISRRGPHLFEQLGDEPEKEIFPESNTKFFVKGADVQFTFVKDSSGKAVKLIFRTGDGIDLAAPRAKDITEVKVDPAVYDSLLGKFDCGDGVVDGRGRPGGALTVTREGNHLFAQLTGQPKFEIFPQSETEYFGKAVDAQVTFVKDATGKVTKAMLHQGGTIIDAPKIQ